MKPIVSRSSRSDADDFAVAMTFARSHAQAGLKGFPFDAVYRAALDQLDAIDEEVAAKGGSGDFKGTGVDLGLMAAKELGSDEQDFAHALCVIQRYIEADVDRSACRD